MGSTSVEIAAAPVAVLPRWRELDWQSALVFAAAGMAVVLFALVPSTTRIAAAQLDGFSIGLIRASGAGLAALPLLLVLRPRAPQRPHDWALLLFYALGNFAGFPTLFSLGTQRTSGAHAALIMAAMPLIAGLAAMVLDRRLPGRGWFVGAAIALVGEAALVTFGNAHSGGATFAGDVIVLAGCALSALGIVAGARLSARMPPLSAALWAIAIAGIGLAPLTFMRIAATSHAYQHLTVTVWVAILQITLGAAVAANVLWLWAVSRGGLIRIAPIQFAQPVCALFFASTLLDERLTGQLLLAAAGIVFGTVTACRAARSNAAKQTSVPSPAAASGKRSVAAIAFAQLPFHRAPSIVPAANVDAVLSERIEQVIVRCREKFPAVLAAGAHRLVRAQVQIA